MGTGGMLEYKVISEGFLEIFTSALVRLMIKLAFWWNCYLLDALGWKEEVANHFEHHINKEPRKIIIIIIILIIIIRRRRRRRRRRDAAGRLERDGLYSKPKKLTFFLMYGDFLIFCIDRSCAINFAWSWNKLKGYDYWKKMLNILGRTYCSLVCRFKVSFSRNFSPKLITFLTL